MGKYTLSIEIVKERLSKGRDRFGDSRAGRANVPGPPSGGLQEDRAMAKSIYDETYARSMRDPEGFWAVAAEDIHWIRRWDRGFDDAKPNLILSASCGIEVNRVIPYKPLLDGAIELAQHKVPRCVILQRREEVASMVRGRDLDWNEALAGATATECVPVAATDPLYILYTSGTTGIPKGVVHDNGAHAVALNWSMNAVYGMGAGECS